jgi:hypothetical protein
MCQDLSQALSQGRVGLLTASVAMETGSAVSIYSLSVTAESLEGGRSGAWWLPSGQRPTPGYVHIASPTQTHVTNGHT